MRWLPIILLIVLIGCRQDKTNGPEPILPETGTTLYFAECNPTSTTALGSLSPDGNQVCNSDISLVGSEATWRSRVFYGLSGSVREGYRLVFQRSVEHDQDTTSITVRFTGVANTFSRSYQMLPHQTTIAFEDAETGDVPASADTGEVVSISVTAANLGLSTTPGSGSRVVIGVQRSSLCEFEIVQPSGEEGTPNHTVNFEYLNAVGNVSTNLFIDYTGGASVTNQAVLLGPHYGVAYLAAQSGECRDTALFYAPPPADQFRVDTLVGGDLNALTDGQSFWTYTIEFSSDSLNHCYRVRIYSPSGLLIVDRYFGCAQTDITYDQLNRLIWIIQRSSVVADTAWGYTTVGALDTTVVATTIPDGDLVHGRWITSTIDGYVRHLYSTPFAGGASLHIGDVPILLTAGFRGIAGIATPGVTSYAQWSINVYDTTGLWVARYPILGNPNSYQSTFDVVGAALLTADSVIVYYAAFVYDSTNYATEIRALKP